MTAAKSECPVGEKVLHVMVDSEGGLRHAGNAAAALGVQPERQVTLAVRVLETGPLALLTLPEPTESISYQI